MKKKFDKYFNKATDLYEKNKLKKALKFFLKAEKIKKGSATFDIAYLYGKLSFNLTKKEQKWYKKIISNDWSALCNLAISYQESYQIKEAKKYFKKAIKCGDIDSNLNLAKIYLTEGKVNISIILLQKILKAKSYKDVTQNSKEESLKILKELKKIRSHNFVKTHKKTKTSKPKQGKIKDVI